MANVFRIRRVPIVLVALSCGACSGGDAGRTPATKPITEPGAGVAQANEPEIRDAGFGGGTGSQNSGPMEPENADASAGVDGHDVDSGDGGEEDAGVETYTASDSGTDTPDGGINLPTTDGGIIAAGDAGIALDAGIPVDAGSWQNDAGVKRKKYPGLPWIDPTDEKALCEFWESFEGDSVRVDYIQWADPPKRASFMCEYPAPDSRIQKLACPVDMVPIYGKNACVDRFEVNDPETILRYPEPGNTVPSHPGGFVLIHESSISAETYCNLNGKRRCYYSEWVQSCKGPENRTYLFGELEDKPPDDSGFLCDGVSWGLAGCSVMAISGNGMYSSGQALRYHEGVWTDDILAPSAIVGCAPSYMDNLPNADAIWKDVCRCDAPPELASLDPNWYSRVTVRCCLDARPCSEVLATESPDGGTGP